MSIAQLSARGWPCFYSIGKITSLYSSRARRSSWLADILMRDINPWMPIHFRFGWDYVADHASTWLDVWVQFVEQHRKHAHINLVPWNTPQKMPIISISRPDKQRATDTTDTTDSHEEEAKELPQEHQVA